MWQPLSSSVTGSSRVSAGMQVAAAAKFDLVFDCWRLFRWLLPGWLLLRGSALPMSDKHIPRTIDSLLPQRPLPPGDKMRYQSAVMDARMIQATLHNTKLSWKIPAHTDPPLNLHGVNVSLALIGSASVYYVVVCALGLYRDKMKLGLIIIITWDHF